MPEIRALELFAGVGGFRIAIENTGGKVVWSNQWEPGERSQFASSVYEHNFGNLGHSNIDISEITKSLATKEISLPEANLLVGGFPCQDYSVAKSKSESHGIKGKKGVLWWEIFKVLDHARPKFVLLENVDRLLASPSSQRGRDFAVMLESLNELGYEVEWKTVNAADYGFPQRRKRLFVFAIFGQDGVNFSQFEVGESLLHRCFPSQPLNHSRALQLSGDILETSDSFNQKNKPNAFESHGAFIDGQISMIETEPKKGKQRTLGSVVLPSEEIPEEYWISPSRKSEWEYLKGSKSIPRKSRVTGFEYAYTEGKMAFPDSLEAPSRTIVTGEGGSSPSRFKHVIQQDGRFRRLVPIELERLNGFPDNWTQFGSEMVELTASRRAFLMGNALVVGLVEKIMGEITRL